MGDPRTALLPRAASTPGLTTRRRLKLKDFDDDVPGGRQLNKDLAVLARRHGQVLTAHVRHDPRSLPCGGVQTPLPPPGSGAPPATEPGGQSRSLHIAQRGPGIQRACMLLRSCAGTPHPAGGDCKPPPCPHPLLAPSPSTPCRTTCSWSAASLQPTQTSPFSCALSRRAACGTQVSSRLLHATPCAQPGPSLPGSIPCGWSTAPGTKMGECVA